MATALLLWGCSEGPVEPPNPGPEESSLRHSEAALISNGGFESGNLNGWTVGVNRNTAGLGALPPTSISELRLTTGGSNLTSAVTGAPESQIPAGLSSAATLRYPKYGRWAAVLNSQGKSYNSNTLRQTYTVSTTDVDPADGKLHIRFALAPVLQDPGHPAEEQPYFYAELRNATKNTQLFTKFAYANQPGIPWKEDPSTHVLYTDWQLFDVAPGSAELAFGDRVEIIVVASGCAQSGHYGEVYLDSFGAFLPGLAITASAPAQANAGTDLTYTYLVNNGGLGAATNTIAQQPLPAGTTFVSVNAPGATCTTPAVGATGTVSCNLGDVNPSGSTTFQITVHIASNATGKVSNGSYTVRADGVSPLIGPLVETAITQNVMYADLAITKSDGIAAATWGQPVQYTIEVTNNGPSPVVGARVTDTMPAQLTAVTWSCTASSGAACGLASGSGNIDATVALPVQAKATFTVNASIISGSGNGSVSNLASVTVPAGVVDNTTSNNQVVDTDSIGNLYWVTVNKDPAFNGKGKLVSSPIAINCDTNCATAAAQFLDGTQVSVTATAATGDTFVGWTGACTGTTNPCIFTVSEDKVLTAQFVSPKAPNGGTCNSASDCASGSCVDGVCCDTACTDQCMACNVAGHVGTCSPVTGAPVGGRAACATDGSVCGGTCNGSSPTCTYPSTSTQCRQASCAGNVETHAASCDGSGACPAAVTASCSPYICGANACLTHCTTFDDCSTGDYCSAQGECLLDNEPPVLVLPAPMVLEATSSGGAQAFFTVTATDAVVGPVPVTCSAASGGVFPLGTTTLTCSAADGHGNEVHGSFTITVVDTTPPVLQVIGPNPVELECGTPYLDLGATASDICSGDLTSAIVTTNGVDSSAVGTYSVQYSVADGVGLTASGTRVVNVQDTLAPTLSLNPGPATLECYGAPYVDPGATAADLCAGDLTSQIVSSSNLDQNHAGQYTVTYTVTDPAGHQSTAVRQLTVDTCCFNLHLGDYNVFLAEDYTGGHDVEGKVAAGRNITLSDFSIGARVPANNTANTLVAGGSLSLTRGGVWGDARYGGSYSTDPSVVYSRGSAAQGTPIDFAARFTELRSLSARLGRVQANGTSTRASWGGITLTGTSSKLNVFDLDASAFTGAALFTLNAPAGSVAVVNIRGASASLSGFSFNFGGGIDQHGVLFNFVDTTRIDATGIGIRGTVLAPLARVYFSNGSFNGGIYAVSLTGNAEGHIDPLTDRDVCP